MGTGAITGYIDVAQLVLYAFWIFFLLLVLYLHRESKREGYPLETKLKRRRSRWSASRRCRNSKDFLLPHGGGSRVVPRSEAPRTDIEPQGSSAGLRLHRHCNNPMHDGLGPGAWAIRPEVPDLTHEGEPKIVPLRVATDFSLEQRDPGPPWQAGLWCGRRYRWDSTDIWVDRSEPQIRYFELEAEGKRVHASDHVFRVSGKDGSVRVNSIKAEHLAEAPVTANPDQITLQEEERICAYYGGGYLYASHSHGATDMR